MVSELRSQLRGEEVALEAMLSHISAIATRRGSSQSQVPPCSPPRTPSPSPKLHSRAVGSCLSGCFICRAGLSPRSPRSPTASPSSHPPFLLSSEPHDAPNLRLPWSESGSRRASGQSLGSGSSYGHTPSPGLPFLNSPAYQRRYSYLESPSFSIPSVPGLAAAHHDFAALHALDEEPSGSGLFPLRTAKSDPKIPADSPGPVTAPTTEPVLGQPRNASATGLATVSSDGSREARLPTLRSFQAAELGDCRVRAAGG